MDWPSKRDSAQTRKRLKTLRVLTVSDTSRSILSRYPSLLHLLERERTGLFPVNIGKTIFNCKSRSNENLPGFLHEIGIVSQCCDCPPDKLWRFRVGQVEVLCSFHDTFTGVETNRSYMMLAQLVGHTCCHPIVSSFGNTVGNTHVILLRCKKRDVDD